MKTYTRIYLLILLMLSAGFSFAQSEDELFHDAGYSYYEKDYPNAHTKVSDGLDKYPGSEKLKALKGLICEKWTCPDDAIIESIDGGDIPPGGDECLSDSDGDGICDAVDKCPDKWGDASHRGCPDTDGDGVYDDLDKCPDDPDNNCLSPPPTAPTGGHGGPDGPPEAVSGCMDPEANNYNDNATESCSNCCRYTINTQFKRVPGKNKMTWNPKLAKKATSIIITYTIKPYDGDVALPEEMLVSEDVKGKSFHIYDYQGWEADGVETDVRLIITTDSKITVTGTKLKKDELFDCSAPLD